MEDSQARNWALGCHLAGLAGVVFQVPFAGIIAPLVIWLIKKDDHPFVDDQGKEALNFQITVAIALVGTGLIGSVVTFLTLGFAACVFFPLWFGIWIGNIILCIVAAIRANSGETYRYPMALRFIH